MGVWQGVAMDSLKFHQSPPCLTLLRPTGGPPVSGAGGKVFYPFGHPTPYAYETSGFSKTTRNTTSISSFKNQTICQSEVKTKTNSLLKSRNYDIGLAFRPASRLRNFREGHSSQEFN
jgi:hypothetical protein